MQSSSLMLPWEKQTFVYTEWKIRLSVALQHGSLGIINEQLGTFPVKVNAVITYFHQQTFGIWNTEEEASVHISSCEEKKNFQTESLHLKEHEQLSGEEITPLPGEKMSDQCAPVRAPFCASKFQVVFTILLRNIIELSHICMLMETFFSKLDEQKKWIKRQNLPTESISSSRWRSLMLWISLWDSRSISSWGNFASFM